MKLWKGNVFTSVCQEFCPQQGPDTLTPSPDRLGRHPLGRSLQADTPPRADPPEQTPSPPTPAQTATAGDGTHPTGMHSCCTV